MARDTTRNAAAARTLLLFGPGAMSLDEQYFSRIVAFVKRDAGSHWALDAIEGVRSSWELLSKAIPMLQQTPGAEHAQKLGDWMRTGKLTPQSTVAKLPNAILGPLVIIAQLVEYLRHVDSSTSSGLEDGKGFELPSDSKTETVGCCLGVFSALVVSSSSTWTQFAHNAAAALRTVFVLGALSDAQDAVKVTGPSVSLISFWRGAQSAADLKKALERFPESYVSVLYDDNRATVTTSARTAYALKIHLQAIGITSNETEFHGLFHAGRTYEDDVKEWFSFYRKSPAFQLLDGSRLVLPTRINSEKPVGDQDDLIEAASRAFLVEQFNWIKAFRASVSSSLQDRNLRVIEFGPERCVPPSLLRRLSSQTTHFDFERSISPLAGVLKPSETAPHVTSPNAALPSLTSHREEPSAAVSQASQVVAPQVAENDIAVIGLSCNVAGAQDLEQYWKILLEGRSQHKDLVPNDRFVMETTYRPKKKGDEKRKWYGNFVDDYDAFDCKFFKKSPREALHMDPQQRLILQVAYQAVAQSGFYHNSGTDNRIGCYIGVVANDYENNISHTSPTAFSATGALRSYIAGKVSHFFGWTGPAMTLDTACSASTVGIDLACKAILSGDCSAALAGGTNFYSTPMFFENLSAGSFLSPTGQCKPFDANADGYCRGEAIGAVLLKRLSHAIADGDQVMGVISATAINQNMNTTPIFVPNPSSLTNVFETVIAKSQLTAREISVVEAHGTGTPVGDPAEYDSIRQVVGGSVRAGLKPLQIGSVKGLIGHTEGASGVVALIKIILMMQEGYIPPQASFSTMNPAIKASPSDNMEVTKTPVPWEGDSKVALINNYGAAGSNASMIIKQAPKLNLGTEHGGEIREVLTSSVSSLRCPFIISGLDDKSVQAYASKLCQFLKARAMSQNRLGIENLAFNINRQSNWSLARAAIFDAKSVDDLDRRLASIETVAVPAPRPVILCFGGQVARFVGLDREMYDRTTVLRRHLDQCDIVCKSINAGSIYPAIFQREPIDDPSVLQPPLFAMQYACGMSWIDCGVEPAALVGHSFGELTALCVSGVLSLTDAMKMVYGRSKTIRDTWGTEKGSLMAVEADLADVEDLIAASNTRLQNNGSKDKSNIACFNGPRSFTLAGSVAAIDDVQQMISQRNLTHSNLKHKRLDVTNAFHSTLVDHLKPDLEALGQKLKFNQPKIPIERATKEHESGPLSPAYVAEHMRQPVYFNHAVQRLAKQHPEAIWLEAGSNATITTMASKALGMPKGSAFQPVNVTGTSGALQQLSDIMMNLWRAGLRVSFWPHSRAQTYEYAPIILPPYQFEKQRHWLDFKPPLKQVVNEATPSGKLDEADVEPPPTIPFTLLDSENSRMKGAFRFRINTTVEKYTSVVSEYIVAKTVQACPAMFATDLAIQAITSVHLEVDASNLQPHVYNISNQSPIIADPSKMIMLDFKRLESGTNNWSFKFISKSESSGETEHMSGQLYFHPANDARSSFEFNRFERLVSHERCLQALNSSNGTEDVIQGRNIYKVYSGTVDYGEKFRGLQKLVGRPNESAGKVMQRRSNELWLDFALSEVFAQVGAIWTNCMAQDQRSKDDLVFVSSGIEQWMRSPNMLEPSSQDTHDQDKPKEWHVLAQHKPSNSGDSFISDIFVFDAASGSLQEIILGIQYTLLSREQLLQGGRSSIAEPLAVRAARTAPRSTAVEVATAVPAVTPAPLPAAVKHPVRVQAQKKNTKADIWAKLLPVLADISGLEPDEIKETDSLAEIGIDSLMGMEMAREVETTFSCSFEQSELVSIVDVPGVLSFVQATIARQHGEEISESSDAESSEPSMSSSNRETPSTPNSLDDYVILDETSGNVDKFTELPSSTILEAFGEIKAQTDYFLKSRGCAGYLDGVSQKQTRLCLVLTSQAFKKLGCDLGAARGGDVLQPVPFVSKHQRFHKYLYKMLEETRIINIDGDVITRTDLPLPSQSAEAILADLMEHHADNGSSHQLTYNVGSRLADVLSGKADGPQLIFGDSKNRELVANFYGELPFNKLHFELVANFITKLATKLKLGSRLRMLELGAGTGGTTKVLLPALANLGIPVEYTFTDLSPSLVAQAKKKFKQYPFLKFAVHDIEQPPSDPELVGSQHIVIASNAVHATHSLKVSSQNIRKFLRPDGFLMLVEMMNTLHWVDVVWGTLEGWWLFEDGRTHAVVNERRWEKELHAAGYKHVDWTDGKLPEVRVQRAVIALAANVDPELDSAPTSLPESDDNHDLSTEDVKARKLAADDYVKRTSQGFSITNYTGPTIGTSSSIKSVLVTGATGSLGSHIVSHLVSLPSVDTVYCLNRPGPPTRGTRASAMTVADRDPCRRQLDSFEAKGIKLDASMLAKLKAIETDSAMPQMGLETEQYNQLLNSVTHVVHNAFPVNGLRSLEQNEPQFATMRNLVDFAANVSARRRAAPNSNFKFTFQFVSSLSAVGKFPSTHPGQIQVPEEQLDIDSALPNGYGGAKVVCERVLQETLGRHPNLFRAMTVRLGQVSGSKKTGYWNHMEVLGFLFKSAQTLRAFPALDGILSWLPLEDASACLGDLLLRDAPDCYPIYHLDNPVRKSWADFAFAELLGVPEKGIVPLDEFLRRVQAFPGENTWDNPAAKAMDFFQHKFEHMSCGGVTMATDNAREHSPTLRAAQPVTDEIFKKHLQAWKTSGFLR